MKIETLRHSLAHIMAYAVRELFPGVRFGIGPAIENGFYYDFDLSAVGLREGGLTPEDLPKIEKKMQELLKKDLKFKKKIVSVKEAKEIFKDQPYKLELISELAKVSETRSPQVARVGPVQIYQLGDFIDLCKGPHVKSTLQLRSGRAKEIPADAFKLTKVAGAYWKGDEKNPMLTRIYGLAFKTKGELEQYLFQVREAEKRDHRILGQKLELFLMDEKIGAGLPLWLPRGALVRKIIENHLYEELVKENYQWLYTPHIGSRKLWEISGHWNFYNESMYPPLEIGQSLEEAQKGKKAEIKEEYLLKPMNCPFHVSVYNSKIRSYRDLPIKYAELGTVYRYERSGTLHGLIRVRGFTQDDAHLICTSSQMFQELTKLVKQGLKILKDFGFTDYNIYLSTRPNKYVGSLKDWDKATKGLKKVLEKTGLKYQEDKGGGVFYGPKIDIKIRDSIGREWQCTTIQFDFNLPERFQMYFINEKGKKERPFMIHRALLGSMERFFGVLLEHYAGALPLWLSPVQIWIIPIGSRHEKYAAKTLKYLNVAGLRSELKDENETVSKKVRDGELQKIPYLLVVGDKEMKTKSVRARKRGKGDIGMVKLSKFIENVKIEIRKKV